MLMRSSCSLLSLALVLAASAAACGGKVVVDAPSGGTGGSGGSAQSSTSVVSSTSFVSSTATSTVTSTVSSTVTTGEPPPICDGSGVCQGMGPDEPSCIQCAIEGPCLGQLDACENMPECFDYNDCTNSCGGSPECQQKCAQTFPEGSKLFFELVFCAVCQLCSGDCADIASQFCPMMK